MCQFRRASADSCAPVECGAPNQRGIGFNTCLHAFHPTQYGLVAHTGNAYRSCIVSDLSRDFLRGGRQIHFMIKLEDELASVHLSKHGTGEVCELVQLPIYIFWESSRVIFGATAMQQLKRHESAGGSASVRVECYQEDRSSIILPQDFATSRKAILVNAFQTLASIKIFLKQASVQVFYHLFNPS